MARRLSISLSCTPPLSSPRSSPRTCPSSASSPSPSCPPSRSPRSRSSGSLSPSSSSSSLLFFFFFALTFCSVLFEHPRQRARKQKEECGGTNVCVFVLFFFCVCCEVGVEKEEVRLVGSKQRNEREEGKEKLEKVDQTRSKRQKTHIQNQRQKGHQHTRCWRSDSHFGGGL